HMGDMPPLRRYSRAAMGKRVSCAKVSIFLKSNKGLNLGAHVPQLGIEAQIECFLEVVHARSSAGAGLVADNALHCLHVAEAPEMKPVFELDKLFRELIEIPVRFGIVINLPPRLCDTRVGHVSLGEIS